MSSFSHTVRAELFRILKGPLTWTLLLVLLALITLNYRGKVRRRARVTTDTRQGVVVAEGVYWPAEPERNGGRIEGGINDLTSQKLSDSGGGATFHESLVAIVPAEER